MAYFGCINKSSSPPTPQRIFKEEYEILYQEKYGIQYNRTYKKEYESEEDNCIVGAFWYKSGNSTYGVALCLIGLSPNDVVYRASSYANPIPYLGTIVVGEQTFYYSDAKQYYGSGRAIECYPSDGIELLNTVSTAFASYTDGIEALLDLALY